MYKKIELTYHYKPLKIQIICKELQRFFKSCLSNPKVIASGQFDKKALIECIHGGCVTLRNTISIDLIKA